MANESKALELAAEVDEVAKTYPDMAEVSAELRRQHTALQDLQTECAALRVNEENLTAQVESLRAQLEALQAQVAQGEPVGWVAPRPDVVDWSSYEPEIGTPLYTAPQQASEPMTDEQIRARCRHDWTFETVRQWVRITEQFHNIKGNQ